ncbi:uncharacterized protein LOC133319029 [Danaus plexippus]|uniref:uncharacterized protein LOC133319029 n=1 Tax=Danaus plexippus TaxID=13037 RepID=UPI002AB2E2D7|nr:uncharacterized protein LOC133319029 [Danaus plexippus]
MRARTLLLALAVALAATARELRVLQDARTSFYLAIAAPSSASDFVRTFNRTLSDLSQTYLAGDYPLYLRNITLLPLYIELPEDERFSARVLEETCAALEGRRVAALLVCGGGSAAAALVSTASRAGVPVIRASPSHLRFAYTIANELLPLEVRLEITARETLHALRATLLHTHWHTFTLLAEENIYLTLSLRKDLSSILTTQPLNPKWLSLPSNYTRRAIFRRLAEVSRLTRDSSFAKAAVRMMVGALRRVLRACDAWSAQAQFFSDAAASCWDEPPVMRIRLFHGVCEVINI